MTVHSRRDFLGGLLATSSLLAGCSYNSPPSASGSSGKFGIPGSFPGKVVAVEHPGCSIGRQYQEGAIREMIHRGMMELTGADSPEEAWRYFFQPGDVVGIKLNPVGRPYVISDATVVREIIRGLNMAGIKNKDIVAYDRYKKEFLAAGFHKWLPQDVRWTYATDEVGRFQLDMDGYDPDVYMELPLVLPEADPSNPHHRRSYVAKFLTREVNKMINLCVLKHHQSAGVTLALKNMSHGLVNNVSRSHSSSTLNACNIFIPAVVELPVIREKVVLHILDGVLGAYHGGPGSKVGRYVWEHRTIYFATDPVALDKTGWKVIDAKRVQEGMKPIFEAPPDEDSRFQHMQVEHIEIAGALGLGVFDDKKIEVKRIRLG